ncbi:endonuclease/exonuclease/phosphatase family protein [Flavobacterium sp. SM2513]|uniref:endonuclease/exonuclease/phosphatase family protein n=1 Tax=Flavobacterium sp. SM2513 TaxID=3424766 RepID=UPI003D7F6483
MKTGLIVFCSLLLLFTLMPFVKKQYWVFRVCEYPRLQKFVATLLSIVVLIFYISIDDTVMLIFLIAMILNAAYLLYLISPFTKLAKVQVVCIDQEMPDNGINIMISNVLQDNNNYKGCLQEVHRMNPDVVLLLEINAEWEKATKKLEDDFAYHVKVPLENKYGMVLYSKFPLEQTSIKYLVEADIPSIHTQVILKNGTVTQLYAVHPTPPVPNENPSSEERDKELLMVADLAKASKIPVVVIGDLNDVAWSYTTTLFLKMSGLLDPRIGRGFFNTFHAHYFFMRFPLDHAFISTDWKLKEIHRLKNFNSDHFPIFISLQYEAQAHLEQEALQPDANDIEEANEKKE